MVKLNIYHFPETTVNANPHWKGGDFNLGDIAINPGIIQDSESSNYFYNLIVSNDDEEANPDAAYYFRIYAFAVFEFDKNSELSEDELAADVAYQGASILFGVIREHLFSITAKSAWGGVQLPIYRFTDDDFEGAFYQMDRTEQHSTEG